jgi:hypothetical protein
VRSFTAGGKDQTSLEEDKVTITDGSGNERIYLGTTIDGNGILKTFDSADRERTYAGVFTDGKAGFLSYDTSGTADWNSTWK